MHTYTVEDGPKMLRETLSLAQTWIGITQRSPDREAHIARLQRLIDECDRKRPTGAAGVHGDLHTPECGCDRYERMGIQNMRTVIDHDQPDRIERLLLGRKVVRIKNRTLHLDNGTSFYVHPNEGCGGCESGNYGVTALNTCDNVITKVESVTEEAVAGYGGTITVYKVFVYAEDTRINLIDVRGDDGNGYYGTGFELIVEGPAR